MQIPARNKTAHGEPVEPRPSTRRASFDKLRMSENLQYPLMVSLSNHVPMSGGILRQAQDERGVTQRIPAAILDWPKVWCYGRANIQEAEGK